MMMSSPPAQSPKNGRETSSVTEGVKKSRKKTVSTPAFSPKQYPKPTLTELALLVGSQPKQPAPPPVTLVETPLPYKLNWREHGAHLSLQSANQGFIATHMGRLQTHVVQPMVLPSLTVPKPTVPVEQPIQPQNQLKNATDSQLSALLGLADWDGVDEGQQQTVRLPEAEDACPTSVELEFETPVEAQLASYLGVKYTSTTTISVVDNQPQQQGERPWISSLGDKALLPSDSFFSDALEAELAQQKAWLAAALEREQLKSYPRAVQSGSASVSAAAAARDASLVSSFLPTEAVAPLPFPTPVAEEVAEAADVQEIQNTTLFPPIQSDNDNDEGFAAVLGSLMADFADDNDESPTAPVPVVAVEAGGDLSETPVEETPSEVTKLAESMEVQQSEGVEIMGIYAKDDAIEADADIRDTSLQDETTLVDEPTTMPVEQQALPSLPPSTHPFEGLSSFNQYLKASKANSPMDFMLLGAYFLKHQEKKETFSLRQLNHLLSSVSKPNANHTVLELALAKHFITMVPDLTGTATTTQYSLSKTGDAATLRLAQAVV
jgi:hypothetical protein